MLSGALRGTAEFDALKATSAGHNDALLSGFNISSGKTLWVHTTGGAAPENLQLLSTADSGDLVAFISGTPVKQGGSGSSIEWISPSDGSLKRRVTFPGHLDVKHIFPNGDVLSLSRTPTSISRVTLANDLRWTTPLRATHDPIVVLDVLVSGSEVFIIGRLRGDPMFGRGLWSGAKRREEARDHYFLVAIDPEDGALLDAQWLFSSDGRASLGGAVATADGLVFALNGVETFCGHTLDVDGKYLSLISLSRDMKRVRWIRRFPVNSLTWRVQFDVADGSLFAAGYGRNPIDVGSRSVCGVHKQCLFLAELAPDGRVLWSDGAAIGRGGRLPAIARDLRGSVYVAASVSEETKLGDYAITPSDPKECSSIFIAKLERPAEARK